MSLELHRDWVVIHRDSKNAFNEIDRNIILQEVKEHIPDMSRYAIWSLANNSEIFYRDNISNAVYSISSNSGIPQGAPSSPMLFQLGQNSKVREVLDRFPTKPSSPDYLCLHIADDGYLLGQLDKVLPIHIAMHEALESIGLQAVANSPKNFVY
jgi:hypothetical protein